MTTREKIINAAAEVFAQYGLSAATTKVLAEKAGVNETTLFRLFGNKEAIFDAAIQHCIRVVVDPVKITEPLRTEKDFKAAMRKCAARFYKSLTVALVRLEYFAALERPSVMTELLLDWMDAFVGPISERIKKEQGLGNIRKNADPQMAALLLNNAIFHHFTLQHIFNLKASKRYRCLDGKHIVEGWLRGITI